MPTLHGVTGVDLKLIKGKFEFRNEVLSNHMLGTLLRCGIFGSWRSHGVHDSPAPATHSA